MIRGSLFLVFSIFWRDPRYGAEEPMLRNPVLDPTSLISFPLLDDFKRSFVSESFYSTHSVVGTIPLSFDCHSEDLLRVIISSHNRLVVLNFER